MGCGRWKKKGGSRRRAAWPHSSEDGEPDAGQRRGSVQSGVQRRTVGTKGPGSVVGGTSAHGHATAGTKRGPWWPPRGVIRSRGKRRETVGWILGVTKPFRRRGGGRGGGGGRKPSGGRGEGVSADGGVAETSADRHGRRRLWRVVAVGRWPPRRHGKGLRPAGVVGTGIPTLRRTPELGYWEGAGPAVEQLVREGRHAGGVPEGITPGAGTLLVYPCGAGRAG